MSSHEFSTDLPVLTPKKLQILEETTAIGVSNKLEILELFNHSRFLTEKKLNENSQKLEIEILIEALELPCFVSRKKSKRDGIVFEFFIVCANHAIKEYMQKFEYEINDYELAAFYGYHPKSILAFNHLLARKEGMVRNSPHMYFNSKVFSKDFLAEEDAYHKTIWEQLRLLSPKIISEAEEYFAEKVSSGKA